MSESGFASLGPTLLARKGGAKPAMRPQVAPLVADEIALAALADEQLEDLGWNDMGDGEGDLERGADVVPINAAVAAGETGEPNLIARRQERRPEKRVLAEAAMGAPVDAEDALLEDGEESDDYDYEYDAEDYDAEDIGAPYAAHPAAPAVAAQAPAARPTRITPRPTERRAAFTLRLDPVRHLKLRLAATMQGVSAQVLLTEALDTMLAEFDDLDVIAAHLKRH